VTALSFRNNLSQQITSQPTVYSSGLVGYTRKGRALVYSARASVIGCNNVNAKANASSDHNDGEHGISPLLHPPQESQSVKGIDEDDDDDECNTKAFD
jgi:hypothetical protein